MLKFYLVLFKVQNVVLVAARIRTRFLEERCYDLSLRATAHGNIGALYPFDERCPKRFCDTGTTGVALCDHHVGG